MQAEGNKVAWVEAVTDFLRKWKVDPTCERRITEQHWCVLGKLLNYFNRGSQPLKADFNAMMMAFIRTLAVRAKPPPIAWPN